MRTHQCSKAFTLVETLVVIGIISILMALVIPAIMRVRAASDKLLCANNLRQIGVALHMYEGDYKLLPPGCSFQNGKSTQPYMSWLARILPYIEEESLWNQAEQAFTIEPWFESVPPHSCLGTVVKKYTCPSDNRAHDTPYGAACTWYLGVEGTNQFTKDGMLFLDSKVRISDAKDGASNTLLVGERPPNYDMRVGWWYAGWGQNKEGSCEMVLGVREQNVCIYYVTNCPLGIYEYGPGKIDDPSSAFHFWSLHSGGANFLFCDGSVHFIPYFANPIMPAMATRNGGEAVVVDFE